MAPLHLNTKYLESFIAPHEMEAAKAQAELAAKILEDKSGAGNDFLGWTDLPVNYDKDEFARIKAAAKKIQQNSDILIVIGIGGSYLGARAAIELMKSPLYNNLKARAGSVVVPELEITLTEKSLPSQRETISLRYVGEMLLPT